MAEFNNPARSNGLRVNVLFGDMNPKQQATLEETFGRWPVQTACIKKGCNHGEPLKCWNQAAPYPIDTLQPCLYLPKVMDLLPNLLSVTRRQWEHVCLLAKFYRMPVLLHFSEILPYHKRFRLRNADPLEIDAYLFCLIYTVGRLIDRRGVFPAKFGFMPPYDQADTFDWKFDTLWCRDRTFHLYEDGQWEEEIDPFTDPDEYFAAKAKAERQPDRKPHHTVKLLYHHYDIPTAGRTFYRNAYYDEVIEAFAEQEAKYTDEKYIDRR
ncbi:hypothetical protein PG993_009226 [Apiospora rasikravindrae]|uniref:Uncharacterized protein n=1 Tax=Apiospora rasikravindrae TaxID=990691 RepID=A0ABR1SIS5_9PEZI